MTLDEFFTGRDVSRHIYDALSLAVGDTGPPDLRVTKSRIAFRRRRALSRAWTPGKHLRGDRAPLVLTVALSREDTSKRWKQIVSPADGRYSRQLEHRGPEETDPEVGE